MEIKELETQTEREMAAVILEQVIEIRKLRLALKAHEDVRKVQSGGGGVVVGTSEIPKVGGHGATMNPILKQHLERYEVKGGSAYPTIDPMAVDVRSVV